MLAAVFDVLGKARGGEGVPVRSDGGRFSFCCGMPGRAVATAAIVKIIRRVVLFVFFKPGVFYGSAFWLLESMGHCLNASRGESRARIT